MGKPAHQKTRNQVLAIPRRVPRLTVQVQTTRPSTARLGREAARRRTAPKVDHQVAPHVDRSDRATSVPSSFLATTCVTLTTRTSGRAAVAHKAETKRPARARAAIESVRTTGAHGRIRPR